MRRIINLGQSRREESSMLSFLPLDVAEAEDGLGERLESMESHCGSGSLFWIGFEHRTSGQ